jgi:trehalose 6-phosphate synthase
MLRLSLRFLLPLVLTLTVLGYAAMPLVDSLTLRWFLRDLDARSQVIATTLAAPLVDAYRVGAYDRIERMLTSTSSDERVFGLALCDAAAAVVVRTAQFPPWATCAEPASREAGADQRAADEGLHITRVPVAFDADRAGRLVVAHYTSYISSRSSETRGYIVVLFAVLGLLIAGITLIVAHLSWRGWIKGVRAMLGGEGGLLRPFGGDGERRVSAELRPIESEVRALLRRFERESNIDDGAAGTWSAQRLRTVLQEEYAGDEVIVVSNREPYSHERRDGRIAVTQPASGLVTALEPVLRAASGTWIAHGSGSADAEVSDADGCVQVPPQAPAYTLRRLWLSPDEIKGYYEGFANEGLWPLCHIAHVRPVFRAADWQQFVSVSSRFADAVARAAKRPNPLVLVQDYHMALVPQMIRERLPQATIMTFWHIPWPMSETFGICPWREEILDGLLGSHIMGFQTPTHCRNFIDAVDTFLEARIEHESSTIHRAGRLTQVLPYPISIAWPPPVEETIAATRARVLNENKLPADQRLAVGIDRLDYIKGLEERFAAVECLLAKHPQWVGRFTLVQVAAPSRSDLPEYRAFRERVEAEAGRINRRFANARGAPILLKVEHHGAEAVRDLYRAADVGLVTSLHDGMNLVAKEFIAARDDELGVLVLSCFTGASRELHEALIVNPYSAEETGDALARALAMPVPEQQARMRSMRSWTRSHNIYRWAGKMLSDAARVRSRERVAKRIEQLQRRPLRVVK